MPFQYQKNIPNRLLHVIVKMFINIAKPLLKIGWRGQMLLTMLEIHVEFSTVPYTVRRHHNHHQ